MSANSDIVRRFIDDWSRLDADVLVEYFTHDGTYHNIPVSPVSGRANLHEFIRTFLATWTSTNWVITNLFESGDTVIAERIDRTRIGNKSVDLPCCGVFEIRGGKIAAWRDYFDLATYQKVL